MVRDSSDCVTFSVGRLTVGVRASRDDRLRQALLGEVLDVRPVVSAHRDADFEISRDRAVRQKARPAGTGRNRNIEFTATGWNGYPALAASVRLPVGYRFTPDFALRAIHPGRHSRAAHAAQLFCDGLFDPACQLIGLDRGQTLVHAAGARSGDRCVLIVGRGGTGKTGTLIGLVRYGGWAYLSDDLAVLDGDGVLHVSHHRPTIAPRNLANDEEFATEFLSTLGPGDRAAWTLHQQIRHGRGLRRKPLAESVFRSLGSPAPVTEVIHVRRCEVGALREVGLASSQAAQSAAAGLRHELRTSMPSVEATIAPLIGATPSDHGARTVDVFTRALAAAECSELQVPWDLPEEAIEEHLLARLTS